MVDNALIRWEFCGPFINTCKRLLSVLLSADPNIRRLVAERKKVSGEPHREEVIGLALFPLPLPRLLSSIFFTRPLSPFLFPSQSYPAFFPILLTRPLPPPSSLRNLPLPSLPHHLYPP